MKLRLTVVLTIIGMIVGAVVWAYASFTTIPTHNTDIENVEEDVGVAKDSILRELDQMQQKLRQIDEHWHVYEESLKPQ